MKACLDAANARGLLPLFYLALVSGFRKGDLVALLWDDLEHIPLHGLRHTFATVALQNSVDVKTVSSMLGHYDAGFTLRTYTHATRQVQNQTAQAMGNFMSQVM